MKYVFLIFCALNSLVLSAQNLDSIKTAIASAKEDTVKISLLIQAASAVLNNNPEQALKWSNAAEEISRHISSESGIAKSLKTKGDYYKLKGDYTTAIEFYSNARNIFDKLNDVRSSASCGNSIATCYFETGRFDECKKILAEVLDQGKRLNDKKVIAGVYMRLGNAFREEGDFSKSLEFSFKAASLFEELDDKRGLASTYNNIAIDFKDLKDFQNSIKYHQLSLDIKMQSGDKRGIAFSYSNLGNVYRNMNDFKRALAYLNQSLALRKEMGDKKGISQDLQNIGIVYRHQKKYDSAFKNYMQSLSLKKEIGDAKGEAVIYFNTAQLMLDQEKVKEALDYLDKSETLAIEVKSKDLLADILALRSQAMEQSDNQKEALENLKRSVAINDSLMTVEKSKQIVELQTKYETEKKDKLIIQKNLELEKQRSELERKTLLTYVFAISAGALILIAFLLIAFFKQKQKFEKHKAIEQTRTTIANDLHDDIGATLSSINIYSQLAKDNIENGRGEAASLIEKISTTAKEMMNSMSDVIWSIKPSQNEAENLADRIRNVASELLTPAGISFDLTESNTVRQPISLSHEAKRNIFLIVKESLNNIAKYSKADSVLIELSASGNRLSLHIKDNGSGFILEDVRKRDKGNGLKNMKQRTELYSGTFELLTLPGKGTIVKAEFSIDRITY